MGKRNKVTTRDIAEYTGVCLYDLKQQTTCVFF